ncbi:MAG: hypothetical protein HY731_02580 [Candidatus Tectomicrobia bacterium]|nr:hypothetical protein [Candidatus Tectomicrobia bacterium]
MRKLILLVSILSVLTFYSVIDIPSAYSGEPAMVEKLKVQIEMMKKEQAELEAWLEKLSKFFAANPQLLTEIGKFRESYVAGKSQLRGTLEEIQRREGGL